jgi:hypothetical protein
MSIVLVGSTSGSITLQEPAVAGSTVLTLPAVTGTVITTGSPQSGSVLQVVNATYGTNTTTTSTSFSDTGLTASITPTFSTSKILAFVQVAGCGKNADTRMQFTLVRTSTTLLRFEDIGAWDNTSGYNYVGTIGTTYLDSPATTSATTYKVQWASFSSGVTIVMNNGVTGCTSTITLMEIAA